MFNQFRITQRFVAIMAMYWLTFLLLAVLAIWGLMAGANGQDEVARQRFGTVNSIHELIKLNQANRMEILLAFQHAPGSALAGIHDHPTRLHLDAIEQYRASNDAAWSQLRADASADALARLLLEDAYAKCQLWTERIGSAMAAIGKQDYSDQAMAAFLAAGRNEGQAMFAALEKLLAHQNEQVKLTAQHAQRVATLVTWVFIALAVLVGLPATWMFVSLLGRIRGGFAKADEISSAIAAGDLTLDTRADGADEIGQLLGNMHTMRERLLSLIREVRHAAEGVQVAATEVAAGNMDLSNRTEQTAGHLQQTAGTTDELSQTVRQNADNAVQADQLAKGASEVAERGGTVVGLVVQTMKGINDSSRKISDIIGVIDSIAFQTNILALNAAVEAARAGEQGRGFAVVAAEVRSLAQRSAEAAREIKQLISASVEHVDHGSLQVNRAGSTMQEVVAAIRRVSDIVGAISVASKEQSEGVALVGNSITQMDHATQQNAALVEQSAAAAASLRDQADQLVAAVAGFRRP
ncbi:methyl-accepting chemotaxis protein [Paucibacter soli]|uniref:methyl-accepting chemotaxis protein n=1 Tax=Paucibacter soli TaxID=3133433 RepID=UPI00309927E6